MRSIVYERFGAPEVLHVVTQASSPLGPRDVRVAVRAAGVNFADTLQRRGAYPQPLALPQSPGGEIAGVVVEVGDAVGEVAPGDRVAALVSAGGYSDEAVIEADAALRVPDGLNEAEATALLVQGLTAAGLRDALGGPRGDRRVWVSAGAGGVGSLLIQLLVRDGERVFAGVSSAAKAAHVAELGATPMRYDAPAWSAQLNAPLDAVFDSVGGDVMRAALERLGPFGTAVVFGAASGELVGLTSAMMGRAIFANQHVRGFALPTWLERHPQWRRATWERLADDTIAGRLVVSIGGRFTLDEAPAAHALLESRGALGKLVLTMEAQA